LADQYGYRPDPEVAKLMHHLRLRRKTAFKANIAALTTLPETSRLAYPRLIAESAARRAESLGYGFTLFRVNDPAEERAALRRVLRGRGVEGLLLLPLREPAALSDLLSWGSYPVVAATYGLLAPVVHRVVPNQFSNMLTVCAQLAGRGYRRIGLVQDAVQDVTVRHGFSGAVAWQNLLGGTELVRPLMLPGGVDGGVETWFEREQPDVIVAAGDEMCRAIARRLGLRIPGQVGFVSANRTGPSPIAGIEERPEEIGATALELLAAMIQRGEKGVPAVPKVTMVEGRWIDGPSVKGR
jgi:DNA-binding LacI/PurR family transcriptional regulator